MNFPRSHSQKSAEPGSQPWSNGLWGPVSFTTSSCTLRFGGPPKETSSRPRWGPRDGKKADLRQLGHGEHSPPGIKGCHRHSPPSTLCSQVGKRPDHLTGATLTPSPSRALCHCCSDSPCNHGFLFGAETRPGQWGEGSRRPSGQGLLWREGGGPEERLTQPPGILGGWEPRQEERVSVNKCLLGGRWLDVPRMQWNVRGTARLARWSSPDPVLCFRGQLRGEQGPGPRDSSWLQPPRLPTLSPTQNHRAPSSWAGAQNHRASVPPRCGVRASVFRPQAPTAPPHGPLAPPGPQAHAWTQQDSASLTIPQCFTPTHLHRRQHRAPVWAPKFMVLASFLPSLIHSSFIQTIPFWARHSAGRGGAAKSKVAREPPQGAHGLSRKCLTLLQTAV